MAVTYGIDISSATSFDYTTDYGGYFISALYTIGTNLNQRKIKELEWTLVKPLRTGEGIKIEYRTNLTDSFTEIETWSYSDVNVGAITSKVLTTELPNDIKVCEQIQLKVSLLGTATTTPELRAVFLR